MSATLREITVNGVRYYHAADVEAWHIGLVERSEQLDRLENDPDALREFLREFRARGDAA